MFFLQRFTLRLVFRAANLGPWGVAVLDEGLDADLDLGLDGGLGVLDEAALLVVLVALLLLLSRVGRCVGSVAPTVVRVVAQHLLVVLGLLHHLHLVNASLACGGNACEIYGNIIAALTVCPRRQRSVGGVERESVDKGAASPEVELCLGEGEGAPGREMVHLDIDCQPGGARRPQLHQGADGRRHQQETRLSPHVSKL